MKTGGLSKNSALLIAFPVARVPFCSFALIVVARYTDLINKNVEATDLVAVQFRAYIFKGVPTKIVFSEPFEQSQHHTRNMSREITEIGLSSRFSSRDLVVSHYCQQPSFHLATHAHAGWSICFVIGGDYRESCRGNDNDFKKGDIIVKPAGTIHEDRFGNKGADCLLVELSPQMEQSTGVSSLNALSPPYQRLSLIKLGTRMCRELRLRDCVTPLALEALTLEAVAHLLRSTRPVRLRPPAWLGRVRDILESALPSQVTLQGIAHEVGVHPAHLSRVFRKHWGCSIGDYLRNKQVEAAAKRLTESDEGLAPIAYSLGFADQSHFTRVFKEFKGTTPRQYRRLARKS